MAGAGLNKVMIIGNLGKDPEMRFTANGSAVTNFSVAVGRQYSGPDGERREETEWFTVVAWNKLAEQCNQFLQKGRKVYVEGRLQTRSWDGTDGVKHYKTEVVALDVRFLDRGPGAGGGEREGAGADMTDPDDLPFE
ncbi:MAG: single-stranded DNA-binding protein [Dehalococcoidia bacterium]